jgi:hypothetical protein
MPEYFVPCTIAHGRETTENRDDAIGPQPVLPPYPGLDPVPGFDLTTWGRQTLTHKTIGLYASTTTGDDANEQPAALRAALDAMNANAAGVVLPVSGGTDIRVPDCCFAGPPASAQLTCDPADVGSGAGQITPDKTLITAAMLIPHPSVFVRKADRIRGIYSQQIGELVLEPIPAASPAGQAYVQVWQIDRAPTLSGWVISVDGHSSLLGVEHPAGSDLRRPRDIWAQVLVPLIAGSNSTAAAAYNIERVPGSGGSEVGRYRRGIVTRLAYLEYARFQACFDESNTTIRTGTYSGPS